MTMIVSLTLYFYCLIMVGIKVFGLGLRMSRVIMEKRQVNETKLQFRKGI